ncbi:Estrogen sulfotransferase [Chlorella vulgaris]
MPADLSAADTEEVVAAVRAMEAANRNLETAEGRQAGASLQCGPEDIMVVSPPKCGTTWLCQIVHMLRSGGDMSFEEINLVIPCIEMAYDYGMRDMTVQDGWRPRVYKTHFWHPHCPKGAGRYLFITRDPLDAGPSFYHFLQGWIFDEGALSMQDFLTHFWLRRGEPASLLDNASHWHTMASWYPRRNEPNVLWLHYEDLHQDLPAAVKLIAEFLGLGADNPELQALTVERSSIGYMKQFPEKYNEHMQKLARNEACGRPKEAGLHIGKVRSGKSNRHELSPELRVAIQEKWEEVMLPVTGYKTYDEMRHGINSELGRPWLS